MAESFATVIPERLPAHMRVTYSIFMTCDATGLEMTVAVNDLPAHLAFSNDASPQAIGAAVGFNRDHFEGWRFMTAEETADYIERRNRGDIDDFVEEV